MSQVQTLNPATEERLESYQRLSNDELQWAIVSCHEAFLSWRHTDIQDRAATIKRIGAGLQSNKDALAQLMTAEMGKLLSQSQQELDLCVAICEFEADHGPRALETTERELVTGGHGRISYAPLGVIYGIQPWNYPAYQVIRYAIASLVAGNAVLLKHAANVTGTGQLLAKIFQESGLPEGLFQALVISHEQSDAVIEHPLVRGVTLTGSVEAGRTIGRRAAGAMKKTVLELGSNDAYLVLHDAELDKAVKHCIQGRIYNNGETCIAAKRFIVVDAVYDDFRDAFVEGMDAIAYGDPTVQSSQMGPMAKRELRDTLQQQVDESVAGGATIACGGHIPEGTGFYYPATVLEEVTSGQPAYADELFGPVAALIRARDQEHAMQLANDSRFGLGGGIMSADEDAAIKLAEKHFDTGMVFINTFGLADPAMPFGGVKDSGYGREHGGFGLKEFVNVKAVMRR